MIMVYIACPIERGVSSVNYWQASETERQLIQSGYAPINPARWMTVEWKQEIDYRTWMDVGLRKLRACDAVLRIPGESRGADLEEMHAGLFRIPCFYSLDELEEWALCSGLISESGLARISAASR